MATSGLSDTDYNALVNSVSDVLKDGKVELGKIVALGQKLVSKVGPSLTLSLEKKKALVSEIVQKGFEHVEMNVLSKLSDIEQGPYGEQLLVVASQLKDKTHLLLDALSVKNPYFSYLFGLCCGGGPLPDESSVVSMVVDKVQVVQTAVEEQVQNVHAAVQVVEDKLQIVQTQVEEIQVAIQESVSHQRNVILRTPSSDEPATLEELPANKVVEKNLVVETSKVPENDLD
jgi:hypothetical protein